MVKKSSALILTYKRLLIDLVVQKSKVRTGLRVYAPFYWICAKIFEIQAKKKKQNS